MARVVSDSPRALAEPLHFEFSGKTAPNRFMKASMTERLSSWDARKPENRGVPSEALINVYRRWGEGGFGVILTGNVMLDYDQLEAKGNPIIPPGAPFEGERFEGFRELAAQAKAHGSLVLTQLSHPGRQVPDDINPHPISASDVQLEGNVMGMNFARPRAMEKKDIDHVVDGFAYAAEYSYKAGFDGVELHGAHGYLIAQFLSPTTNKRTDAYGGTLANRARIILDISAAIRRRVPDPAFSVGIKLNSVEFQDGGFTPEDCRELVGLLEGSGFDFVELSGGTYQSLAFSHQRESTRRRESFFLEFAELVVPRLRRTRAYVTGGFRTAAAMAGALATVHGVGLARPIAHEFDLPRRILEGEAEAAKPTRLDEDDFGITNVAAGTAIRTVGKGKQPLDLGREDHLEAFMNSVKQWGEKNAANTDNSEYGYVDINGVELEPYGKAYAPAA